MQGCEKTFFSQPWVLSSLSMKNLAYFLPSAEVVEGWPLKGATRPTGLLWTVVRGVTVAVLFWGRLDRNGGDAMGLLTFGGGRTIKRHSKIHLVV